MKKLLLSRTFWTLVFMLGFNVFNAVKDFIPDPVVIAIINSVLTTLAAYYKLHPSQKYESEG